ncbi:MFS transporter [Agromyces rhizosphaerae]|uniref:MFS transporter n=1 Tax=Agromyces rhizosphaerae TaxID=88374 RepID=A0A9W6FN96_9MICO|nr:MFS transporter [Agromyces rhizosphaerae]GLI26266.1 MFS transporter [Agromyces rhizosphaerae]
MTSISDRAASGPAAARQPNPWWIAVIAGMASFIDAGAIVATGTALVLFQDGLGVTGAQIGQFSALLTLTIAIGAFTGGRLGDRFGRRRVFTVTLIVFAIGAALSAMAWDPAVLYVSLALLGFGAGADLPVSMAMIAESAPDEKRGKMITFSHVLWMAGILAIIVMGIFIGGMGTTGGRILYGFLAVVAVIVLVLRATLPESAKWQAAHDRRTSAIEVAAAQGTTVEADPGAIRSLFRAPVLVPLIAVGLFYALVNVAANTNGQFSTYLYVNVAGSDVSTASALSLIAFGVSLVGMLTLMRLVDTRWRMRAFAVGAVFVLAAMAVPAIFGVTLFTLVLNGVLFAIGGAIAGEPMFKVWAQELFSTLSRSGAQGVMIAFTRVVAAGIALVTPAIIAAGPQVLYWFLFATSAVALAMGAFWIARMPRADLAEERAEAAEPAADAASVADAAPEAPAAGSDTADVAAR